MNLKGLITYLMNFVNQYEFLRRFFLPTNKYWATIRNIGIGIFVLSTFIVGIGKFVMIPIWLTTYAGYVIVVGATLGLTAQNTSDKPSQDINNLPK